MNLSVDKLTEKRRKEYQSCFKQKADILTLKTKPDRKVEWPIKSYQNRYEFSYDQVNSISANASVFSGYIKKRRLYLDTSEESVAKVGVTKQRQFKRTPWDPQLNRKSYIPNMSNEKSELDTSIVDDLIHFVNCSKSSAEGRKEMDTIDNQDTSLIKDLSLQLIDQVLINIANPIDKDSEEPTKDLDWEFMLANVLQTNLPKPVIERVKRHMALATGKKTPAITALNVTPCQLSDLTISDTECELLGRDQRLYKIDLIRILVEMKATLRDLYVQTETESFEPVADDDVSQDIRWLMDLSRKDKNDQILEIATINEEYSNRVLNLKPAFF
ncbi:hypothetical protein MBANPS3_007906 [Mucor bainieri]